MILGKKKSFRLDNKSEKKVLECWDRISQGRMTSKRNASERRWSPSKTMKKLQSSRHSDESALGTVATEKEPNPAGGQLGRGEAGQPGGVHPG